MAGDNDSATATLRTPAKSFFIVFVLSLVFSALALPARLPTEPGAHLNPLLKSALAVPWLLNRIHSVN